MSAVLAADRATFRAFATAIVPEMAELDAQGWDEAERTIEHALSARPPKLRRQIRLLLRVINQLPRLRYGRPFTALDVGRRVRFLEQLQRSPLMLVRRGVWGLRTLVLMGYYTRTATMNSVGYRAHPRGWNARSESTP